ncbi:MAG: TIGR00725 family protein [Candidatus Aminicenantia bacterium]
MNLRERKRIGVIGGNEVNSRIYSIAYEVGSEIARHGFILVCGGLGGVMEAVAKGAKENGGITIGILPGIYMEDANKYIDIPVPTGISYARNMLVVLNSSVVIAINGRYGTLSEISYANIFGKKVIGLETWEIDGVIKAEDPQDALKKAINFINSK